MKQTIPTYETTLKGGGVLRQSRDHAFRCVDCNEAKILGDVWRETKSDLTRCGTHAGRADLEALGREATINDETIHEMVGTQKIYWTEI